jgi:hypothetical protein
MKNTDKVGKALLTKDIKLINKLVKDKKYEVDNSVRYEEFNNAFLRIDRVRKYHTKWRNIFTYEVEVTVNLSGFDFYTNSYCTRYSRRVSGYYRRSFRNTVFSELKYFGIMDDYEIVITKISYKEFE